MVMITAESVVPSQEQCSLLAFFTGRTVDNSSLRRVVLFYVESQVVVEVSSRLLSHCHVNVGSI